jgi:hypothetical protein
MQKLDFANRQTLFDLIYLGIDHQIQPRDTFGIWTMNTRIYAGEYPMQVYDPEKLLELASRATFFLKSKKYTGKCEMELCIFSTCSMLSKVKDVNILILTDGSTPMRGTPFDETINLAYKNRAAEQRKTGKPFITTLVLRGGAITQAIVTLPGEDIDLPPPLVIAKAPPPPPPAPKPAPKALIMKPTTPAPSIATQPPGNTETAGNGTPESNTIPIAVATMLTADNTPDEKSESKSLTSATHNEDTSTKLASKEALPTPTPPKDIPDKTNLAPALGQTVPPEFTKPPVPPTTSTSQTSAAAQEKSLGPTTSPTAPMAVVAPKPIFNPQILILAGGLLLAGALSLLVLVFRRLHKIAEPSIITRSMEHRS